jgi:hypothetical protein
MINRLSIKDSVIHVHVAESSLKTTKNFTHGSLVFDLKASTVTFGKLPPVAAPEGLALAEGTVLKFQLVAPNGTLSKQTRSGVLKASDKQPDILRIVGMSKTQRKFSAEDGWGYAIYKYRAYFSHPGLKTNAELPEWLKVSITRQKAFWNRMAWLCREARLKCSPVPTKEIIDFVQSTILPEIDAFNKALGRSSGKMKHPAKLKIEMPGLDGLWNFAGELRTRTEKGRAVPAGLLDKVVDFSKKFKADYAPFNEFLDNFMVITKREAATLALRHFEIRPLISAFNAVLDRRKTTKAPWSEGWPLIKYPDSPKAANWGLHYNFRKAGVNSTDLESGKGIPGLSFGPPLNPSDTGHNQLKGVAAKRILREAQISISGDNDEPWNFRFGVLQHRPLPPNSHLKEWKLIFQGGALWLCLVVELQRSVPVPGLHTAGLDIGWRRAEDVLRFGTLYEPVTKTFRTLTVNLQKSPNDHKDRVPFSIDLGPSRWEKRNAIQLLPDWKPDDPIPSAFETRSALQVRRDVFKETAKNQLREHLGERLPAWFDRAGRHGLLQLAEEFKDDGITCEILNVWQQKDEQLGKLVSMYFDRSAKRIAYGHAQVAHDVCRYLKQKCVTRLIVEASFLAIVSKHQKNEDSVVLKRSQKYRHFVAVGKFMAVLKNTAMKYGITVDTIKAANTTRICQYCNALNPTAEKEEFTCNRCGKQINQDQNAAVNLSRFGSDTVLAEMALHAADVWPTNLREPQASRNAPGVDAVRFSRAGK